MPSVFAARLKVLRDRVIRRGQDRTGEKDSTSTTKSVSQSPEQEAIGIRDENSIKALDTENPPSALSNVPFQCSSQSTTTKPSILVPLPPVLPLVENESSVPPKHVSNAEYVYEPLCGDSITSQQAHLYRADGTSEVVARGIYGSDNKMTRLVVIVAGVGADKLECELIHTSLASLPEYEALSYAWERFRNKITIRCSGKKLSVPSSLVSALKCLRHRDRFRTLWVDFICINQQDALERGHQVSLMSDIYSQATRVVVWLGRAHKEDYTSFDTIRLLNPHLQPVDSNGHADAEACRRSIAKLLQEKTCSQEQWHQLLSLFTRPWFRCLWVFQEVVLPREVILTYEQEEINFNELEKFIVNVRLNYLFVKASVDTKLPDIGPSLIGCYDIFKLRRSHQVPSITSLPSFTNKRKCTNPRDRIYALLGMVNYSTQQALRPDYSLGVLDVYRKFTIHELFKECSLQVLSYCTYLGEKTYSEPWPSWIPDLNRYFSKPNFYHGHQSRAARNSRPQISIVPDPNVLRVNGLALGRVCAVGSPLGDYLRKQKVGTLAAERHSAYRTWLLECFDLASDPLAKPCLDVLTTPSNSPFGVAFLSTVLGNSSTSSAFQLRANALIRHMCSSTVSVNTNNMPEEINLVKRAILRCLQRCFCKTDDDRLGLLPILTQPGDVIAVLFGGNVPFVLRKDGDDYYKLIGEAYYVHGLMKGEALDMGEIKPQAFKLR